MNSIEQVSCLINNLTNDEDLRQDLWVCYLNGMSTQSFSAKIESLHLQYTQEIEFQKQIWNLIKNPPSDTFSSILDEHFTDFERHIIFCLVLGMSSSEIAQLRGISQVRIEQMIATVRYNSVWEQNYGTKKEFIR